jgi:hypothetical protein
MPPGKGMTLMSQLLYQGAKAIILWGKRGSKNRDYLASFGNYRLSGKKARYGMYIKGGMFTDEVFITQCSK